MNPSTNSARRDFLTNTAAASAAVSMATVLPSHVLGRDGTAPNDRISLGVIGIGPRCTYDLTSMLKFADIQCVAIADVQAKRRESGKALVDGHYQNSDCIRSREKTAANADVMRRSHIASHAAAIAWILGRKLKLDPVKEEFIDDADANSLRSRAERNWAV